jgi:hypothetical protein
MDVFFAILASKKLPARARLARRALQLQGARFRLFSNEEGPDTTLLPMAARIEPARGEKASCPDQPCNLVYIGQKLLELLTLLKQFKPAKWYVVCDDDSFPFVDPWRAILSLHDAEQPLLLAGREGRNGLCAVGLCNDTAYRLLNGRRPVLVAHSGGACVTLSAPALKRMQAAIHMRECLDANFGDLAIGMCARIANVSMGRLAGHHALAHSSELSTTRSRGHHDFIYKDTTMTGRIASHHRLSNSLGGERRVLCWSILGECDPRCECECKCDTPYTHGMDTAHAPKPCPCDELDGLPTFNCSLARDGPLPKPPPVPSPTEALRYVCTP